MKDLIDDHILQLQKDHRAKHRTGPKPTIQSQTTEAWEDYLVKHRVLRKS